MSTVCNHLELGLQGVRGRKVVVMNDGQEISSDGSCVGFTGSVSAFWRKDSQTELSTALRMGDRDASHGSVAALEWMIPMIRARWPKTRIILRGDSGFCREVTRPSAKPGPGCTRCWASPATPG